MSDAWLQRTALLLGDEKVGRMKAASVLVREMFCSYAKVTFAN